MVWEEDWPVVNPGVGKLEDIVELPYVGESNRVSKVQSLMDLGPNKYDVVTLRNHQSEFYCNENGRVRLRFLPPTMKDLDSPAYLGFRQLGYKYEANLEFEFSGLAETEEAGLVLLQSNEYHMLFRVKTEGQAEGNVMLQVVKYVNKEEHLLAEEVLPAEEIKSDKVKRYGLRLKMRGYGQKADFIRINGADERILAYAVDIHEMSTEVAKGFVGNTIGVYASSCGVESQNKIDIIEFNIRY